ncbi:MAG: hypothetical protein HY744_04285 [Deltaproteobacteria bacterium]|nr:hypothetical protein [Deltaproteobacteria bacterium]
MTTVYDDRIYGTTAVYTAPQHNDLLGQCEYVSVQTVVRSVGGTSPTLSVATESSNDQSNWIAGGTYVISAADISGTNKTQSGSFTQTSGLGATRLKIWLGGTAPEAHLVISVCRRTAG